MRVLIAPCALFAATVSSSSVSDTKRAPAEAHAFKRLARLVPLICAHFGFTVFMAICCGADLVLARCAHGRAVLQDGLGGSFLRKLLHAVLLLC